MRASVYRLVSQDRSGEFTAREYERLHFFPHRFYYLPKCGPDGYKLAQRMVGPCPIDSLREVVLYAEPSAREDFPAEVFFDNDIVWHQQHFGKPGQVASANLVLKDGRLYSMGHVSDIVQRIGRRRDLKTRIERVFQGWVSMLLNAVLNYAVERSIAVVRTPTSELALLNTDRSRHPHLEMFHNIYDKSVLRLLDATPRQGWWEIEVARNRRKLVPPETRTEVLGEEPTISVCHDIERGAGHVEVDPEFARHADESAPRHLEAMLGIEQEAGVQSTYCILGALLSQERDNIERGGHCLAFHSYDHALSAGGSEPDQLIRCRSVDYRLKGYRPPQSKLTPELRPENLLTHNFEWIASSRYSLGIPAPVMAEGLVRIPIATDDFPLYKEKMRYDDWEKRIFAEIESHRFVAFGMHDCYGGYWLPRYRDFLARLKTMGCLKTFDQVASDVTFAHAE